MTEVPADEIAWARDVLANGGCYAELAESSGRSIREWKATLNSLPADPAARAALRGRELAVAELYEAGDLVDDIAAAIDLGQTATRNIINQLIGRGALAYRQDARAGRPQRGLDEGRVEIVERYLKDPSFERTAQDLKIRVSEAKNAIRLARKHGLIPEGVRS